jgi:hypothetical protein
MGKPAIRKYANGPNTQEYPRILSPLGAAKKFGQHRRVSVEIFYAICSYRIREYASDPDTQQYSTIPHPPPWNIPSQTISGIIFKTNSGN